MRVALRPRLLAPPVLLLLLVPGGHSLALSPMPLAQAPGLLAPALAALEAGFFDGEGYREASTSGPLQLSDQAIGILIALEAARFRPDQAAIWQARVASLWNLMESAHDPEGFYARAIPPPARTVCIDAEKNAWALLAALAIRERHALPEDVVERRIEEGQALLVNLLQNRQHQSTPACTDAQGEIAARERTIPLIALLDASAKGSASNLEGTIRSVIDALAATRQVGGFPISPDVLGATFNAQMLFVLEAAAVLYSDPTTERIRDEALDFVQNRSVARIGDDVFARNLQVTAGTVEPVPGSGADLSQLWAARALALVADGRDGVVDDEIVRGLVRTFYQSAWLPAAGSFVDEAGGASLSLNAAAALLTSAPELRFLGTDRAAASFNVPALPDFTYPPPAQSCPGGTLCDAAYYVSNQLITRFTLADPSNGEIDVILTAAGVGPFDFGAASAPRFHPEPKLIRTSPAPRLDLSVNVRGGVVDVLEFTPSLSVNPATYRLEGWAPIQPLHSEFAAPLRVTILNNATVALVLRPLTLELDATRIEVRSVLFNDQILDSIQTVDGVVTEQLPRAHVRVVLNDLSLPPGEESVLEINYEDNVAPAALAPTLFQDPEGRAGLPDDPPTLLQGETVYVRATVRDNAALRSVLARFRLGSETIFVPMEPLGSLADTYQGVLVAPQATGKGAIQVVAVDAAGNLNETQPIELSVENPLLSGSLVLFVFSATLFVTSIVIWFKVRRRTR